MDKSALYTLSYGLFVVGAAQDGKLNGMISNTLMQATDTRLTLILNKAGLTHDMVAATGRFSASVLCRGADFGLFKHFGFRSGRDCEKFDGTFPWALDGQGLPYLTEMACARFSCQVVQSADLGSHTWFLADMAEAERLLKLPPITYADYHADIKPAAPVAPASRLPTATRRWRCKICGYIYEGESLPADFVCPLCKHGANDFEEI